MIVDRIFLICVILLGTFTGIDILYYRSSGGTFLPTKYGFEAILQGFLMLLLCLSLFIHMFFHPFQFFKEHVIYKVTGLIFLIEIISHGLFLLWNIL